MNFDPRESLDAAYRIAVLPREYSTSKHRQLLERGFKAWGSDGEIDYEQLVEDIETFGTVALDEGSNRDHAANPVVQDPAVLAVLATLSAACVKRHEKLTSTPPENLVPLQNIRELYSNTIIGLVQSYENQATILEDITDVLYKKPPGEDGPHPGRVCTGITTLDDGNTYLKIPMPAASRKCMVRVTEDGTLGGGYDVETKAATGEFVSKIEDNIVHVPVQDCDQKLQKRHKSGFPALLDNAGEMLPDDELDYLAETETAISEKIDHFMQIGHKELIWDTWNPQQAKYDAIRQAILESGDVTFDEFYSAEDIFDAIQEFDPDDRWKASQLAKIASRRSLGNSLTKLSDDFPVEVKVTETGYPNEYKFTRSSASSELEIKEIEDLFELPCLANMDERLQKKGPVRKDLYSFTRLVMWLPQYQDASLDEIVEDLKEVFQRWPWYNEQETEYQIRYEFTNTIEGNTPLPMNCDNDDMQRYCIGKEECPFSIYGSLPFPEEMYEQISDQNDHEF